MKNEKSMIVEFPQKTLFTRAEARNMTLSAYCIESLERFSNQIDEEPAEYKTH